jgi:hypothetical protein
MKNIEEAGFKIHPELNFKNACEVRRLGSSKHLKLYVKFVLICVHVFFWRKESIAFTMFPQARKC